MKTRRNLLTALLHQVKKAKQFYSSACQKMIAHQVTHLETTDIDTAIIEMRNLLDQYNATTNTTSALTQYLEKRIIRLDAIKPTSYKEYHLFEESFQEFGTHLHALDEILLIVLELIPA